MAICFDITVQELCESKDINIEIIEALVEYQIAETRKPETRKNQPVEEWRFSSSSVNWIRKAIRLQRDLEIDWIAVATIIDLLKQNESLELENRRLAQRLKRHLLDK